MNAPRPKPTTMNPQAAAPKARSITEGLLLVVLGVTPGSKEVVQISDASGAVTPFIVYYDQEEARGDAGQKVPGFISGEYEVWTSPTPEDIHSYKEVLRQHVSPGKPGGHQQGWAAEQCVQAMLRFHRSHSSIANTGSLSILRRGIAAPENTPEMGAEVPWQGPKVGPPSNLGNGRSLDALAAMGRVEKIDPRARPEHIRKLEQKLETKRQRLAVLNGRSDSENKRLAVFPMGPGCGNASSRKAQSRSIDASVNRAVEAVQLARDVALLENELQGYKAGKFDERGRRRPPTQEDLEKLISVGEVALKANAIQGRVLNEEDRDNLKETLKHYRALLRSGIKAAAVEASKRALGSEPDDGFDHFI